MINLNLSKQTLQMTLEKAGVTKINPCQVSFAMDASASFTDEHTNGYTEHLLGRILPFALLFDKDGVLDMFSFANDCGEATKVTADNYLGYVKREFPYNGEFGWGTAYQPPFQALIENGYTEKEQVIGVQENGFFGKLLGKKEKQIIKTTTESIGKHLSFFITDGEASDQEQAKRYLNANQEEQHFIIFITIASRKFYFFEDNYKGKSNTDYFNFTHQELHDLQHKTDEELYSLFGTQSLINWMNK